VKDRNRMDGQLATEAAWEASGMSPATLRRLVIKHWAVGAATFGLIAVGTAVHTNRQTKIYQATATLEFDPNPPRPLGQRVETVVDLGAGNYWDNQEYYETQYRIIQSRHVATEVVRQLGLARNGGWLHSLPPGQEPSVPVETTEEQAAQILLARLSVTPVRESRLANVRLEDADPKRAQRVLTVIVDTYVAQNLDNALVSTTSASEWLKGQLDKLKVDLESSEQALHQFKQDENILSLDLDDKSNMLREEMTQLNEQLTTVRARRQEIAARVAELAKVSSADVTSLPSSELLQNIQLQRLRQVYSDAIQQRDALRAAGKGENHPAVKKVESDIASVTTAMVGEVRNILGALQRDLAIVQRQEAGLSQLFDGSKREALDLNGLEIKYKRLQRDKENNEQLYSVVLARSKESDLTRMLRVNNIRVLERPLEPSAPIRPRTMRNVLFGMVAGVLVGLAASLARALLDRTIDVPEDIERDLLTSFLGLLPVIEDETARDPGTKPAPKKRFGRRQVDDGTEGPGELIVHHRPRSAAAEAARSLRTNLLFMTPDKPLRTLLVTSAGPSEGKTTAVSCIAIAMAQAGNSVIVIDCDLRRPRIHRVFGISSHVGVTSAMLDPDSDLSQVVQPTEVPGLHVMAAGPLPPNPSELLHSDKFRQLLAKLTTMYDRVIIDSSPVGVVTDAAVLSTVVDGTVLVVRSNRTDREAARHAVKTLRDVGCNLLGAVLNAVHFDALTYKYSYSYYRREPYVADELSVDEPATGGRADGAKVAAAETPPAPSRNILN
jgi:succinoglycan biosynthesis transport protein ExoP